MQVLCGLLSTSGEADKHHGKPFFQSTSKGSTTLSASCALLWKQMAGSKATVLAPASLLWPFMDNSARGQLIAGLASPHSRCPVFLPSTSSHGALHTATVTLPLYQTQNSGSPSKAGAGLLTLSCALDGWLILPAAAAALEELLSDVRLAAGSTSEWAYAWALGAVPTPPHPPARAPVHQRFTSALTSVLGGAQPALLPLPSSISACLAVLSADISSPAELQDMQLAVQRQKLQLQPGGNGGSAGTMPADMLLPGRKVMVMGSPFGCLAPYHFANSCMQGIVSMVPDTGASTPIRHTTCPTAGLGPVMFTVDAPCLPGMEGGLVHAADMLAGMEDAAHSSSGSGSVLGMLCLPLSRTSDGVQIQVAISWRHILAGLAHTAQLPHDFTVPSTKLSSSPSAAISSALTLKQQLLAVPAMPVAAPPEAAVAQAGGNGLLQAVACSGQHGVADGMRGVVLVRTQHSWATGVVISPGGLVLTNAHLLMPGAASGQHARAALRRAASQHAHAQRQGDAAADVVARIHTAAGVPSATAPVGIRSNKLAAGHSPSEEMHSSGWWEDDVEDMRGAYGVERQVCRLSFRGAGSPGGSGGQFPQLMRRPTSASCMVRMGNPGQQVRWCAAHVLYLWTNHLDLAVLQLQLPDASHAGDPLFHLQLATDNLAPVVARAHTACPAAAQPTHVLAPTSGSSSTGRVDAGRVALQQTSRQQQQVMLRAPPPLLPDAVGEQGPHQYGSMPVFVVGHGLVGPAAGWPASITAGNVAQVVHAHGTPCMLITTATVHAGASGGAVLDPQGRLAGLVTSNARHASGHTLPNLNFCIPADALQPVVAALLRHEQRRTQAKPTDWTSSLDVLLDVHASRQLLREELDALDTPDPDADRVWNLEGPPPAPPWPGAVTAAATQRPAAPQAGQPLAAAVVCAPRSKL